MALFPVISNLSFAAGMIVVAIMVMFAAPVRACNRYFASFLAARGLVTAFNQAEALGAAGAAQHALAELAFWLDLMAAGTLAAFVIVYTRPAQHRVARRLRFATLVFATAITLALPVSEIRSMFALALPLGEAIAAGVMVWILVRGLAPERTETDWLFAMAFLPLALIDSFVAPNIVTAMGRWSLFADDPWSLANYAIRIVIGMAGLAVGVTLYLGTRQSTAIQGRGIGVLALIGLVAVALGLPHLSLGSASDLSTGLFLAGLIRLIVPLLAAYGLVRYRLFIPTGRVRKGLNRSVLAALFLAVYFIVGEGSAAFFGAKYGSQAIGILAAIPLMLAIVPLERAIQRVTEGIVPSEASAVQPARIRTRAYREQVELAWMDGKLDVKERLMLDRVSSHLGLSRDEAAEVEQVVLQRVARSQYA